MLGHNQQLQDGADPVVATGEDSVSAGAVGLEVFHDLDRGQVHLARSEGGNEGAVLNRHDALQSPVAGFDEVELVQLGDRVANVHDAPELGKDRGVKPPTGAAVGLA
jgi:hypothetical protein